MAESASAITNDMILAPRSQFGPYEVLDVIGAGATGEVYRARDPKLGRDVALKVVRAAFGSAPGGHEAFEREARLLASLSHPHIGVIYGFHEVGGTAALALELVEGETLAARLRRGRLSESEAVRYAVQIADALAYAHERGVVHRDVKPTNIIVTPQGAKLLDFGLAHLMEQPAAANAGVDGDASHRAEPGTAGTPFYMSPEQMTGLELDHRSDIYSLGLVLCQMLTGFMPENLSGISTRTIIRALLNQIAPRPLRMIVERCLASDPSERWLHAKDLQHALVAVAEPDIGDDTADRNTTTITPILFPQQRARWSGAFVRRAALAVTLVVLVAVVVAYLAGLRAGTVTPPDYQQLTFRRGSVLSARFAGGDSIVYSAAWDGGRPQLWSTRPENPESRSLGITNASLLAVSPSGEMAILIGRRLGAGGGMLARLPIDASAPREVLAGVTDGDWGPDGESLAAAHLFQGKSRLEFPIGTVLYESRGWMDGVRVSPDGEYVAFIEHPLFFDDRGTVSIIARRGGTPRALSGPWASVTGLAWSHRSNEVWFTAGFGAMTSLYAADLSGRVRLISRSSNRMTICDIDRTGRVLLTEGRYRLRIDAVDSTGTNERDLSWFDVSVLADLSPDGTTLLINEMGAGAGTPLHAVYMRKSDGSPAIRIGEGASPALSPDGRWAATLLLESPPSITLLPTGAGMPRRLDRGPLADYQAVAWYPDGRRILIAGSEAGRPVRLWTQEIGGGSPKPIGPEGFRIAPFSRPISPDGTRAFAVDLGGRIWLHPLTGAGDPQPIDALAAGDLPIRWDGEGGSFYFFSQSELPGTIYRMHLADGRKEQIAVLAPADSAGVRAPVSVQTTPDGRLFVYSYAQNLSDLYLLDSVR